MWRELSCQAILESIQFIDCAAKSGLIPDHTDLLPENGTDLQFDVIRESHCRIQVPLARSLSKQIPTLPRSEIRESTRNRLSRPGSEYKAFQQGVARQPVRPVEPRGRRLSRGPEAGDRGATLCVNRNPTHVIVGGGCHRNKVVNRVNPKARAERMCPRKTLRHLLSRRLPRIEEHLLPLPHPTPDGAGDKVARGQFIALGGIDDRSSLGIDKPCSGSPQRLRDQRERIGVYSQRRRVKLHEFEITKPSAGPCRHGEPIAIQSCRRGRSKVGPSRAAGSEERRRRRKKVEPTLTVMREHSAHTPRINNQIERLHPFEDPNSGCAPNRVSECTGHLGPGAIPTGVENPLPGVSTFEPEKEPPGRGPVEACTHTDEVLDSGRSFSGQDSHQRWEGQPGCCLFSILRVEFRGICRVERNGHTSLSEGRGAMTAELTMGEEENPTIGEAACKFECSGEPGHA